MQPVKSDTILRIVASVAIVFCQAYQRAWARLASAASPMFRIEAMMSRYGR